MLVLSRQRDETIMIGDDAEITIVDIRGDKVRLGITAPRHVQVHRKEVYDAIRRENAEASQAELTQDLSLVDYQLRIERDDARETQKPKPKPPTAVTQVRDDVKRSFRLDIKQAKRRRA